MKVTRYFESTSAHGYADLTRSKHTIIKLTWMTFICAFLAIFAFQLLSLFLSHHNGRKHSTTSYTVISPNRPTMPPVTVCPYNRIYKERYYNIGLTNEMLPLFNLGLDTTTIIVDFTDILSDPNKTMSKQYEAWLQDSPYKGKSFMEIVRHVSPDCNEYTVGMQYGSYLMAVMCMPLPKEYLLTQLIRVNPIIISQVFTRQYGICMQYRLPSDETISKVGMSQAMHIYVDTNIEAATDNIANQNLQTGYVVQVGEVLDENKWLSASPGVYTRIGLTRIENKYVESTFPLEEVPCLLAEKPQGWDDGHYGTLGYTTTTCRLRCEQEFFVGLCGCIVGVESTIYPTCHLHQLTPCMESLFNNESVKVAQMNYREECQQRCKPRCNYNDFDLTVDRVRFPTEVMAEPVTFVLSQMNPFMLNLDPRDAEKRYTPISVYYESLDVIHKERFERMPIEWIVGRIGGQMAVWMGASILTITQIIIYVLSIACNCHEGESRETIEFLGHSPPSVVHPIVKNSRRRKGGTKVAMAWWDSY